MFKLLQQNQTTAWMHVEIFELFMDSEESIDIHVLFMIHEESIEMYGLFMSNLLI